MAVLRGRSGTEKTLLLERKNMSVSSRSDESNSLSWSVTMRFGTVLMACVLLAASAGQSLTVDMANVCYSFGMLGLTSYFCLELVADQRGRRQVTRCSHDAERQLSRRLKREQRMAAQMQQVASAEHHSEKTESAMDSTADMNVYLGANSPPVLSL